MTGEIPPELGGLSNLTELYLGLIRKTYADLSLPGAIMDRAISWWDGVEGARFNNQEKVCYFPSGAKITFGYLASVRDHLRYQGAAVHFVGIDEASQIPSRQLEYLQPYTASRASSRSRASRSWWSGLCATALGR